MKRKISARYHLFVFVFLVATPLSFILSGINTFLHFDGPDRILIWMQNWLISFIMVYPLALIFVPIARKLIIKIVHHE